MKQFFNIKEPYDNPDEIAQSIIKTLTEEFTLDNQNFILNMVNSKIVEIRREAIKNNNEALNDFLTQTHKL
jgi:hypothetical protein